MAKNVNCAAMGYDCAFSVTAGDDEPETILKSVKNHVSDKHPELVADGEIREDVKAKLRDLLNQSKYHEQQPDKSH
jgi:predicted small metal-binding protein